MAHGGARKGAGRPKGKGRYGEETQAMRVPASLVPQVKALAATGSFKIPLYAGRVQAGYPTAAADEVEDHIDLNHYFVKHPESTFMVRAAGNSMIDANIKDGDLLVVDRSVRPANGKIVVAVVEGEFTVKFLIEKQKRGYLMPANHEFPPIPVDPENGVLIWGVVVGSMRAH